MAWFKLISGKPIETRGLRFEAGVPVEVTDDAMIRKLRGTKEAPNNSFKEVPGPD